MNEKGISLVQLRQRKTRQTAALFLAPVIILLVVFIAYPIIDTFITSGYQWNGISADKKMVGLANWAKLIKDTKFWIAFKNNVIIMILSIIIQIPLGLAMATFLDFGGKKLTIFKVIWFIPMLMSSVAIGFLFTYALATNGGIVSTISGWFGGGNIDLLGNPKLALLTVILIIAWQFTPFYMVYFMAGYTNIPYDVFEAARIDGATRGQYFWKIALPLLIPSIKSAAILSMVGSLKYFDLIYVMTGGGPGTATELMATYMYKESFKNFNMGYGSAIAGGMFILITMVSMITMKLINGKQEDYGMDSYKKSRRKSIIAWVIAFVLAIGAAIVSFTPFIFMVLNSFKEKFEMLTKGVFQLPDQLNWSNYTEVLTGGFANYFKNSVIVLAISLILLLFISACASYPLARFKFKMAQPIYAIIVACMSIPVHITLIPVFKMSKSTGLYDTIWSLIGPYVAFAVPISVFILTSFMKEIPREIEESAEIDGCGKIQMFFSMILPLSKPGMATLAIYNGVNMWNEFSFVNTLTQSAQNRTLPLAIWEFQGQYSMNTPMIMAVLTLTLLPMVIMFIIFQDKLVKGMTAGAVKG